MSWNGGMRGRKDKAAMRVATMLVGMMVVVGVGVKVAQSASTNVKMNVMVPAYFDPSSSPADWAALNSAASSLPNRVVAIANPDSGPGTAMQLSYKAAITAMQNKTGRVVGYVSTSYTSRAIRAVKSDVDKWYQWYPTVNGIFFDEAANTDGNQAYYQSLYNYVKAKSRSGLVVNNPGTATLPTFLVSASGARVADVICTFESGTGGLTFTQSSWTSSYDRANFLGLFYNVTDVNVSDFDYGDVIDHAYQQNMGWVFVISLSLPNPWGALPPYFLNEVDYIKQYNYL